MKENIIKESYALEKKLKALDEEAKALNEQLDTINENKKQIEAKREKLGKLILADIKEAKLEKYTLDNIIVKYAFKETSQYKDETAVLTYLKEHKYNDLVKQTESIKKKELNSKLKTDTDLKEALDSFMETKRTEYVIVTDEENEAKLKELLESKNKSK